MKINKVGQFSLRDFSAFLTRILGEAPLSITEDHGWFKVSLASEEQEKKVISLRGKKIAGGFDLRVFRSNPRMTATEIFSWMTRDVRIQDNMATLDYHPRGVFKRTNSPVREVQAMPQKSTEKNDAQKNPSTPPKSPVTEAKKVEWQDKKETKPGSPKGGNTKPGKGNDKGKGKGYGKCGKGNWWGSTPN